MSVKSLLQIILLLLIIIILGGIYYTYFYSIPENNNLVLNEKVLNIENENTQSDREILYEGNNPDEINEKQSKKSNQSKSSDVDNENLKLRKKNKIDLSDTKKNDQVTNLTKDIEHITTNNNGDVFRVLAKFGKTNLDNKKILDLEKVRGSITSNERPDIYITSDFAKYNYINNNSEFYSNVVIKYDGRIITCDNFNLNIKENLAVAYDNVIVKNDNSIMKAQTITMDLITKDIKINSKEKVKVLTN